jgi:alkanesulfonate monooxygenase SsuD/methylene tetrahydromethanopterin reductase-like flavin-dependent oxidoreductase (luciferase family)
MQFGMQFFPDIGPEDKAASDYFAESLRLVELCDEYGYDHVRTVEHYFESYGGYSPNPLVFLSAASQRTKKARLVIGAVLPVFNHPLKIAGEVGMLDAISNGRLEVGFARAFLPHEFRRFGISPDESIARFDEGVEQVGLLLEQENVSHKGRFHSFENVTSLPRPTQKPRPKFWTAAFQTPESFEKAGRMGNYIMGIPIGGGQMRELSQIYRDAWKKAGHPGRGRLMIAFHMYCAPTHEEAVRVAREPLNRYLKSIYNASKDWTGLSSKDYKGYDKMVEALGKETFETQMEKGIAFVGTPAELVERIAGYDEQVGGIDDLSLQVNFNTIGYDDAARSVRLFGEKVMPQLAAKRAAAE